MEFSEVKELAHLVEFTRSPRKKPAQLSQVVSLKFIHEEPVEKVLMGSPKYKKVALFTTGHKKSHSLSIDQTGLDCPEGQYESESEDFEEDEPNNVPVGSNFGCLMEDDKKVDFYSKDKINEGSVADLLAKTDNPELRVEAIHVTKEIMEEVLNLVLAEGEKRCLSIQDSTSTDELFAKTATKLYRGYSVMTRLMQNAPPEPRSKSSAYLVSYNEENEDIQPLHVFLLGTSSSITITVSKDNTIEQIIRTILSECKSRNVEMIFPYDSSDGYELRLSDDEVPLYEFPALDRTKRLCECGLDSVVLCAIEGFSSKKKIIIKNAKDANAIHMAKIAIHQKKVLLKVHILLSNYKTMMAITSEPEQTLLSVFRKIALKRGIIPNPSYYIFRIYHPNIDQSDSAERLLDYKGITNLNCLDMNIPVKELSAKELLLVEKLFVDSPHNKSKQVSDTTSPLISARIIQAKKDQALFTPQIAAEDEACEEDILLNDISASLYEEFQVHKTNEHGMRQARVLGIDRYFLYNEKRKSDSIYMGSLLPNVFRMTASTQKPMVPIENIIGAKRKKDNAKKFVVVFTEKGQQEVFDYEAKTIREAVAIVAKIKYLIDLNRRESRKYILK